MFQVSLTMEPTRHGRPITAPCLSLSWEDLMNGFESSGVRGSTSKTASSLGTLVGLLARVPHVTPLGQQAGSVPECGGSFMNLL